MSNNVYEGVSHTKCVAARISKNSYPSAGRGPLLFSTRFAAHPLFVMLSSRLLPSKFYSWYIYPEHERDFGKSISSAEYVEDVNTDSVVIIDGLTKVERFPIACDPSLNRTHRTGGSLAGACVGLLGRGT